MEDQSLLQVRLPADLLAEVDAVAGDRGRPVFVRLALRAFLHHLTAQMVVYEQGPVDPVRNLKAVLDEAGNPRVPPSEVKPDGLSAHAKVVLGLVTDRKWITLNDAARSLGLVPRAVEKAAQELGTAGLVRMNGFVVELV